MDKDSYPCLNQEDCTRYTLHNNTRRMNISPITNFQDRPRAITQSNIKHSEIKSSVIISLVTPRFKVILAEVIIGF